MGLCPRRCGGGNWELKEEFLEIDGLVIEEGSGRTLRCLSPPCAKPFCFEGRTGDLSAPGGVATFLKVMVHSISSPANTVDSFHCTKTRMFVDMVGVVDVADVLRKRSADGSWVGPSRSGFIT